MIVGIPTERKNNEFRVAMTPSGAHELSRLGHTVLVQRGAGGGSSFPDEEYERAGATLVDTAEQVWGEADTIVKVKEPIAEEYPLLRSNQVLFTYLHLAPNPELTEALLHAGTVAIAYETVQKPDRSLPLLAPMSEIAGRLSVQAGAHHLEKPHGGRGILLGGVPGTPKASVVVIGGGVAGENAATMALGLGSRVTILDTNVTRLQQLDARFNGFVTTLRSSTFTLTDALLDADLVVGSVLIPGAQAPKLVTDSMVAAMKPGSVLVDIAIDQGGCFEGSHATSHADPTFSVHDTTYYCVANMPGTVPNTSTIALTNVTLPYTLAIAQLGWEAATEADPALRAGLNVRSGTITHEAVAAAYAAR